MVLVTIRARLRDDPEAIRKIHDEVTTATKEMALQAGDISHRVYLNPQDGRDFLGIDEWKSAEAVQAFSANPADSGVLRPDVRRSARGHDLGGVPAGTSGDAAASPRSEATSQPGSSSSRRHAPSAENPS